MKKNRGRSKSKEQKVKSKSLRRRLMVCDANHRFSDFVVSLLRGGKKKECGGKLGKKFGENGGKKESQKIVNLMTNIIPQTLLTIR